jgi:hypothetical protein
MSQQKRNNLQYYDNYNKYQPVGNSINFAMSTSAPFHAAYDMETPLLFPDLFYTRIKNPEKMNRQLTNMLEDHQRRLGPSDVKMQVFLASMGIVGLYIFYRCLL